MSELGVCAETEGFAEEKQCIVVNLENKESYSTGSRSSSFEYVHIVCKRMHIKYRQADWTLLRMKEIK